ncbi:DUF397 domain-containing protein [Actinocorallia sp. B10E7]|uniref:DUF397 domain-containing protein n=1 Tax=Actinocorallia sp. B10E7 TaxID=3153558 RepID=UPI00325EC850
MTVHPVWRKSTRSVDGTSDQCVELAALPTGIGIRDSKHVTSGHLTFSREQLSKVLSAAKAGALDL